jgi:hypothetical protein
MSTPKGRCVECPHRPNATNAGGLPISSVIKVFPLGHGCHMRTKSGKPEDWVKEDTPKCVSSLEYARAVFI